MGLRIIPLNPDLARRTPPIEQPRLERNLRELSLGARMALTAEPVADLAVSEVQRGRVEGLVSVLDTASRALNLEETIEEALVDINTQLEEIRNLLLEIRDRILQDDLELDAFQAEIDRAELEIGLIAGTTRFEGLNVFDGAFGQAEFEIGPGNLLVLTIPDFFTGGIAVDIANATGFGDLARLNLTVVPEGVAEALLFVEGVIDNVSRFRGILDAFRTDVVEAASRTLQTTRQDVITPEAVVREVDLVRASTETVLTQLRRQTSIIAENIAERRTGFFVDMTA